MLYVFQHRADEIFRWQLCAVYTVSLFLKSLASSIYSENILIAACITDTGNVTVHLYYCSDGILTALDRNMPVEKHVEFWMLHSCYSVSLF